MYFFAQAAKNLEKRREKTTPSEKKRSRIVCGLVSQGGLTSSHGLLVSLQEENGLRQVTLKVWSEVLGETILLVPDTPTAGDPVAYTHEEIRILTGANEDELRAVHKIKKAFDGRVYEAEDETP